MAEPPDRVVNGHSQMILACIADHPVRRVHELLPWNTAEIRCRLDEREEA